MKKTIFLFLLTFVMATSAFSEKKALPMQIHKTGQHSQNMERIRTPIYLPIVVFYDSDTTVLEVWCDNDNVQAEVFVYDETGAQEAYSPYMNVAIQLTSGGSHSILIQGEDWYAEGSF